MNEDIFISKEVLNKGSHQLVSVKADPDSCTEEKPNIEQYFQQSVPKTVPMVIGDLDIQKGEEDYLSDASSNADPSSYDLASLPNCRSVSRQLWDINFVEKNFVSIENRRTLEIPFPTPRSQFNLPTDPEDVKIALKSLPDADITLNSNCVRPSAKLLTQMGISLLRNQYQPMNNTKYDERLSGLDDNPAKPMYIKRGLPKRQILPKMELMCVDHLTWKAKDLDYVEDESSTNDMNFTKRCLDVGCVYTPLSRILLSRHYQKGHIFPKSYLGQIKRKRANTGRNTIRLLNSLESRVPMRLPNFICPICDARPGPMNAFTSHCLNEHNIEYVLSDGPKKSKCDYCGNFKVGQETSIPCLPLDNLRTQDILLHHANLLADPARGLDGHTLAVFMLVPNVKSFFTFPCDLVKRRVYRYVVDRLRTFEEGDVLTNILRSFLAISSIWGNLKNKNSAKLSCGSRLVAQKPKNISIDIPSIKTFLQWLKIMRSCSENIPKKRSISQTPPSEPKKSRLSVRQVSRLENSQVPFNSTSVVTQQLSISAASKPVMATPLVSIHRASTNQTLAQRTTRITTPIRQPTASTLLAQSRPGFVKSVLKPNVDSTHSENNSHSQSVISDPKPSLTDQKLHLCELCDAYILANDSMTNHMRQKHSLFRPICKCRDCSTLFWTKAGLLNHKNCVCPICNKDDNCLNKLFIHMIAQHKLKNARHVLRKEACSAYQKHKDGAFYCEECEAHFIGVLMYTDHLKLMHPTRFGTQAKAPISKCQKPHDFPLYHCYCKNVSNSLDEFSHHLNENHLNSDRAIKCNLCSNACFKSCNPYLQHMLTNHNISVYRACADNEDLEIFIDSEDDDECKIEKFELADQQRQSLPPSLSQTFLHQTNISSNTINPIPINGSSSIPTCTVPNPTTLEMIQPIVPVSYNHIMSISKVTIPQPVPIRNKYQLPTPINGATLISHPTVFEPPTLSWVPKAIRYALPISNKPIPLPNPTARYFHCNDCNINLFHHESVTEHNLAVHNRGVENIVKHGFKVCISRITRRSYRQIYLCVDCKSELADVNEFKEHVNGLCKAPRPHFFDLCDFCDCCQTDFHSRKTHLIYAHKKTTVDSEIRICQYCFKTSFDFKALQEHQYVRCPFCSAMYPCLYFLNIHLIVHHALVKITPASLRNLELKCFVDPDRVNRCPHCSELYEDKSSFWSHILVQHRDKKLFPNIMDPNIGVSCAVCVKGIYSCREMIYHLYVSHNIYADFFNNGIIPTSKQNNKQYLQQAVVVNSIQVLPSGTPMITPGPQSTQTHITLSSSNSEASANSPSFSVQSPAVDSTEKEVELMTCPICEFTHTDRDTIMKHVKDVHA